MATYAVVIVLAVLAFAVLHDNSIGHADEPQQTVAQKIEDIKRLKPEVLIIGTARAEDSIDIRAELLPEPALVAYNAAGSALGAIRAQRELLESAQGVHPLKIAILTLDFFAFNALASDPAMAETSIDNFSFSYSGKTNDDTFGQYREMLRFARKNNIQVYLVISPIHISQLEKERADSVTMIRVSEWKSSLMLINYEVAKEFHAQQYPLWDFAYPNSLTREEVPAEGDTTSRMQWFADGGHYRAALGDVVLRKVLLGSDEYPDFGRRLDH